MSRVLVTGAGGFVGRHLVPVLRERDATVVGLDAKPPAETMSLEDWHTVDLRDAAAVTAAVEASRPDRVVHLAGQSSVARSLEMPAETFQANVGGTWNLLEAVRRASPAARVIVVGSSEVYGPIAEGERASETAPFRPVSPYAFSKAAADALAEAFARVHGLDVVRTRSFAHAGPGQAPHFVVPSLARQIAAIEANAAEPVLRVGNLEVTRDLTDVRDVARAYADLLERGRAGAVYNVCRGEGVRLTEVVRRLIALARVPVRVEVDPARLRPADVECLVGDPSAIERDTGWRATIPLDRTLEDVLEEWRAQVAR